MHIGENYHVAGIGRCVVDQLVALRSMPEPDEAPAILGGGWCVGGKVPTALLTVRRLGFSAKYLGSAGGVTGRYVRRALEGQGVNCDGLADIPGTLTPISLCLSDCRNGTRSMALLPQALPDPGLCVADTALVQAADADYLLICEWRGFTRNLAERRNQNTVVMDADAPGALDGADFHRIGHLLMSEACFRHHATSGHIHSALSDIWIRQGGRGAVTVVTLGAQGGAGIDENGAYFSWQAWKTHAVDTTGAGDVFHGAYIVGRLKNQSAKDACNFAAAVSAIKCAYISGQAGIPTMDMVRNFLRTGQTRFDALKVREAALRVFPF